MAFAALNFCFGFQQPLLRSAFPHSHEPRKKIFVLEGTILKKSDHPDAPSLTPGRAHAKRE